MSRSPNPWLGPLVAVTLAQVAVTFLSRLPPTLAPAMAGHVQWSVTEIGLLTSLIVVGSAAFTIAGLPLVLRAGSIRSLQLGLVVGAAGCLLYMAPNSACAILGSLLIGVAAGPQTAAGSDVLRRHAPAGRQNLVFSIKQAGVPLGGVVAGLSMPWLADWLGLLATFAVCAALAIATLVAIQPQRRVLDAGRDRAQHIHPRLLLSVANLKRPLQAVVANAQARRIAAVGGLLAFGQGVWFAYLISYLVLYRNLPLAEAGALFALMQAVSAFGRPAMGWLADRMSANLILQVCCIGSAVASAVLALVTPQWPYWALATLMAVGGASVSSWNGVQIAQVARYSPPGAVGEFTTGATMLVFLANIVGPVLFGALAALSGSFRLGFVMAALVTLAALPPLSRLPRN